MSLQHNNGVTFLQFHGKTANLTGPERLAAFGRLPDSQQADAWADLGDRARHRADLDFRDYCGPGQFGPKKRATPDPARVVSLEQHRARRLPGWAHDVLLGIDPSIYVAALTGVEVPASGMIRCPLPGHDERTPSFRAYPSARDGFYCFGCGRGGTIYDFAAALWDLPTRGSAFVDLRRRLASELLAVAS